MDTIILDKLIQLMPLWAIIIIGIVFFVMRFYYTRYSKLEDTVSRTDEHLRSIEELLISLNSKSVAVDTELTTLDTRLNNDEDILNTIAKWVVKQDETMIDDIMKKRSPYTLTNIGEQILQESGAAQVLEQCMAQYIADLEAKAPKTAYDVEDLAYDVLFKHSGDDAFKPIKDYLYLAPDPATFYSEDKEREVEVRLSLMSVLRVMSLPLRDAYLEQHPELNPLEDPHQQAQES